MTWWGGGWGREVPIPGLMLSQTPYLSWFLSEYYAILPPPKHTQRKPWGKEGKGRD